LQKRQGIYAVLAAVAIQLVIGIVYIWSVFQTGIAYSIFDGNNAAAAFVFSLVLAGLAVGSLVGGRLTVKYSTRRVVFIGGIILGVGSGLASFTQPQFGWLLWLSYGVMGGFGMGFTYTTTIACAQKWYPHKKGLVTGIIVAALGFGGVIFTPIIEWLIGFFGGEGVGELNTFLVLGVIFLIVCSISSIFLVNPPEGYMMEKLAKNPTTSATPTQSRHYTPSEMLKTPQCYILTFAFVLSVVGGLMMISFARPFAVARGMETTATIGVLAIALFNSMGRMFWGGISDKLGRVTTLTLLLILSGTLSLLVNVVHGYFVYAVFALIGFSFGGILANFPALTSDLFGSKYMGANYGFVLLGFGAGGIIATQVGGYFANIARYDISLMLPAFIIATACAATGIILMFVLRAIMKKASHSHS